MRFFSLILGFDFVAGEVAEAVVGGVLVEIVEGGIVEHLTDDVIEAFLLFNKSDT